MRGSLLADASNADEVRARLLLEGFAGWEEREHGGRLEFVFYRAADAAPAMDSDVAWDAVEDEDWAHAWKRFWKPQRIGNRLVVKPSWEPFEAGADDLVIELDPGMAFGTGTHETTRMCMEWLESVVRRGDLVLDVGTGSGILAITALKLGALDALCVDSDPVAVTAARENLSRNGFSEDRARVLCGQGLQEGKFDVVTANLVADAIIGLAPGFEEVLADNGCVIASGIIFERLNEVRVALESAGLKDLECNLQGEWVSVRARRWRG